MTVVRLRAAIPWGDLTELLPTPHDHMLYGRGHGERVDSMIDLARRVIIQPGTAKVDATTGIYLARSTTLTVADLSCGNGAVARALAMYPVLGDFAPGYPIQGPIEETLPALRPVDVFVLGETLEHLDDPGGVLRLARERASWLVLSTPIEAWDDPEPQHYWAWDRDGVEGLLTVAGWEPVAHDRVDSREYGEPYLYGIWVAR